MTRLSTNVIKYDSIGSTNTEAASRAIAGAPEGTCIVAREQTAGRGRLERRWVSPKDAGLYFSIVLRPQFELRFFPLITLMASLAVRDAIELATGVEADIKWPNDVLVHGRKVCGILAETVERQNARAVILGIGINLTADSFPPELADQATSLESAAGSKPDPEHLLELLKDSLAQRYERLQSVEGAQGIIDDWQRASSFANGKNVTVANNGENIEGITRGLEPDGALRVETTGGKIEIIYAGDVTAVRALHPELPHA